MSVIRLLLITGAAMILCVMPTVWAQDGIDSYVLLVGIGRYADDDEFSLSELKYSHNDLELIESILPALDGFAKPQVTKLWEQAATRKNIVDQLETVLTSLIVHPERNVLVYFSGHGIEFPDLEPLDEDDGWDEAFVPYDYELERSPPTAELSNKYLLSDDYLKDYFQRLPECSRFIFIADSCHSGGLPKDGLAGDEDTKRVNAPYLAERGLVTSRSELLNLVNPALLVLLAAQDGESALVSNKNESSVLTYALSRALNDDCGTCDRTGDGLITLDELKFYLTKEVDRIVQAEYNMKGQQVQIASGLGQGDSVDSRQIIAVSDGRTAVYDAGKTSYWTAGGINSVGEMMALKIADIFDEPAVASASELHGQPVGAGQGVGWHLLLDSEVSVVVVSFDAKGNASVIDNAEYGDGIDWEHVGPGEYFLPGGMEPQQWPIRFERAGLEFGMVLLLEAGQGLNDYRELQDAIRFGYRSALQQLNSELALRDIKRTYPGVLILPYEVQP